MTLTWRRCALASRAAETQWSLERDVDAAGERDGDPSRGQGLLGAHL